MALLTERDGFEIGFTKQEFVKAYIDNPIFRALYNKWRESKFEDRDLKPTVRKPAGDLVFSLDNVLFMDMASGFKFSKGYKAYELKKGLSVKKTFSSLKEIADEFEISGKTVSRKHMARNYNFNSRVIIPCDLYDRLYREGGIDKIREEVKFYKLSKDLGEHVRKNFKGTSIMKSGGKTFEVALTVKELK